MAAEFSDETKVQIPIRNLISIVGAVAVGTWAYSGVIERLNELETKLMLSETQITQNSEFRIKWPLGELGALPADAKQDMNIEYLKASMVAQREYLIERLSTHERLLSHSD